MLRALNLSRPGLQPLSFEVAKGECVALSGPSGSGKTLLLRALADLDPHRGEVSCGDTLCARVPAPHWRRLVGYVPAEPAWWADRVADHFADWPAAQALLNRLGISADCAGRAPAEASTGERQRLALLRLLQLQPRVILLDEPTGALDPANTARVEGLIRELCSQGLTVLWVTHDAAQAQRVASRQWTMQPGGLLEVC